MGGSELYLIAAVVAGFGVLFARERWRRQRQLSAGRRHGLAPGRAGLVHLPAAFQHTVLFHVGDGGHEREVLVGALALSRDGQEPGRADDPGQADDRADRGAHAVDMRMTVFDFRFQRDIRGEWAYLDTNPGFRIFSPVTVVAFELPFELSHILIKRRGRAEILAEDGLERYRSVVDMVRDVSTIDRAIAVSPPDTLPREPDRPGSLGRDYLVWAQEPNRARAFVRAGELDAHLRAPVATGRELVIEMLSDLMLVYCASDGALSGDDRDAFVDLARELGRRACASGAAVDGDRS